MSISTVAAVLGALSIKLWPIQSPATMTGPISYECYHHFTPEILSTDPLMIYMNHFLTPYEIDHLLNYNFDWTYPPDLPADPEKRSSHRTSSYFSLEDEPLDDVVSCIVERAETLVGFIPSEGLEPFQIGRTQEGEHHAMHADYHPEHEISSDGKLCNRVASFFVFLSDVEEGGETYFPFLDAPPAEMLVDENKFRRPKHRESVGMMLKPVKGNGIFWMNMDKNGTADERSKHAGMKVVKGTKYGLNILVQQCF